MTDEDVPIPPTSSKRTPMGCRVSEDVQKSMRKWVTEKYGNRKGAFGYVVEQAMKEYMNNDRYERVERELTEVKETTKETKALVRRLITAEKEKGVFLENPSGGNAAGDRIERENAVVAELARRCVTADHGRTFSEEEINATIAEVANVSSGPSKRSYRESFIDRDLLEQSFSKYRLTDAGLRVGGWEVSDG